MVMIKNNSGGNIEGFPWGQYAYSLKEGETKDVPACVVKALQDRFKGIDIVSENIEPIEVKKEIKIVPKVDAPIDVSNDNEMSFEIVEDKPNIDIELQNQDKPELQNGEDILGKIGKKRGRPRRGA